MSGDQAMFVPVNRIDKSRQGLFAILTRAPGHSRRAFRCNRSSSYRPSRPSLKRTSPLRCSSVLIYGDLLRPVSTEKVPLIVAWSGYGKALVTSTVIC